MNHAADIGPDRADAIRHHLRAIDALLDGEGSEVEAGDGTPTAGKIDVSDPKRWLPMSIAAKRARITPRRMVDWIEEGRVRAAKLEGRVFIDATTILADPVQPSRSS